MLHAAAGADAAALEPCDDFLDHDADWALFFVADHANAAGAVEEYASVDEVEVEAEGHETK